jgi:hypothetical protein
MDMAELLGVMGNERTDQLVDDAVKNGLEWYASVRLSDFLSLSRVRLLESCKVAEMVVIWEDMLTLFGL